MTYEHTPAGFYPPDPAPQPRRRLLPWLAALAALVVLAGAGWLGYDRFIKEDPGVAACKALASGDKTVSGAKSDDKPITEADYRQLRKVFEDSRHADIRDHGTKLMDLVWQVSQMGPEPGMEALAYMGPLTQHMTGLQSACADQGVIVSFPTSGQPSAPAKPKCADVFRPGEKIPAGFAGDCVKPDGGMGYAPGMECKDGRKLYAADQASGVVEGWGYGGGKYRAEDTDSFDSKYMDAFNACI